MTCQPLNIDRLQLMAFSGVDAITPVAAASDASASLPRTGTPAQNPCVPVAITVNGPSNAGVMPIIARRAKGMRFRSNESRKRFLAVHKALATYLAGRDHA